MLTPLLKLMIRSIKQFFLISVILVCLLVVYIFVADNLQIDQKVPQKLNSKVDLHDIITFKNIISRREAFNISAKDLLILMHIQKTGGTSFGRHLVHNLKLDISCACNNEKRRCSCPRPGGRQQAKSIADTTWLISRFSTGWVCGLHPDWTQLTTCLTGLKRLFFLTFLRNPLDRFVSEFRHVQRGATWKASKSHCKYHDTQLCYGSRQSWSNVSLEEFLSCPNNMAINRQTRMLASYDETMCDGLFNKSAISTESNVILESAMDNLKKVAFFGLCEQQRASQLLFERTFNMRFVNNFKQSEDNKTRAFILELPDNVRDRILKINNLDVKLYEYASNLFAQRLRDVSVLN